MYSSPLIATLCIRNAPPGAPLIKRGGWRGNENFEKQKPESSENDSGFSTFGRSSFQKEKQLTHR